MWRGMADCASVIHIMFYCVISLQSSAQLSRLHSNSTVQRFVYVNCETKIFPVDKRYVTLTKYQ